MYEISAILANRKKYLLQLEKDVRKQLKGFPEGTLRISKHRGKLQYYQRKNKKDTGGTYIRQNNKVVAEGLAQKDYDRKMLVSIRGEIEAIDAFFSGLPEYRAEEIFDEMNEARKALIDPLIETDDSFAQKWQDMTYTGKTLDEQTPCFLTDKGERVRSKSEMIIANQLVKFGVPYHYECPLDLKGFGKVYPDFTVLNVRKRKVYYWEHQGMMDDSIYVEKALRKTATYQKNGIYPGEDLILTSETRNCPLDVEGVIGIIQHFLK